MTTKWRSKNLDNPFLKSDAEPAFSILRTGPPGSPAQFTLVCLECSDVTQHRELTGPGGLFERQKKHRAEHLGLTGG